VGTAPARTEDRPFPRKVPAHRAGQVLRGGHRLLKHLPDGILRPCRQTTSRIPANRAMIKHFTEQIAKIQARSIRVGALRHARAGLPGCRLCRRDALPGGRSVSGHAAGDLRLICCRAIWGPTGHVGTNSGVMPHVTLVHTGTYDVEAGETPVCLSAHTAEARIVFAKPDSLFHTNNSKLIVFRRICDQSARGPFRRSTVQRRFARANSDTARQSSRTPCGLVMQACDSRFSPQRFETFERRFAWPA